MVEIIISGNGPSRYRQIASSDVLGRQYDNISEAIRFHFPEAEADKTCLMTVKRGQKVIDVIEITSNILDIRNHISQYDYVDIGFAFVDKETGYAKNSEIVRYRFDEAMKPEDFVPETSAQSFLFSKLLDSAFCNVVVIDNVVYLYNLDGALVKTFTLDFSDFVSKNRANVPLTQTINGDIDIQGKLSVAGLVTLLGNLKTKIIEATDITVDNDLNVGGNAEIEGDAVVNGDLIVNGTTTTVEHENLAVNDNIIITNAGAETQLSTISGLAINTGEMISATEAKAYGIVYDPLDDSVKIGLGKLALINDNIEFVFDENEAQSVVTRDETLSDAETGTIPIWDNDKQALKSSNKKLDDYITTKDAEKSYIPNIREEASFPRVYIADKEGAGYKLVRLSEHPFHWIVAQRDGKGNILLPNIEYPSDPWAIDITKDRAISIREADRKYVPLQTNETDAVQLYGKAKNGGFYLATFRPDAHPHEAVQRDGSGNIRLPNQLTTAFASDDQAISKRYADFNYYPMATRTGIYRICGYNSNNEPLAIPYSDKADTSSSIAQRTPDKRLKVADPTESDDCVTKGYADSNYLVKPESFAAPGGWYIVGVQASNREQWANRISVTVAPSETTIPYRDKTTQTFEVGEPTEDKHPATKKYVDDHTSGNIYAHTISYSGYTYEEYDPETHLTAGGSFTLYLGKNAALTNAQIWKILEQRIGQVLPYMDGNDSRNSKPLNMVNSLTGTVGLGASTTPDTYFVMTSITDVVTTL